MQLILSGLWQFFFIKMIFFKHSVFETQRSPAIVEVLKICLFWIYFNCVIIHVLLMWSRLRRDRKSPLEPVKVMKSYFGDFFQGGRFEQNQEAFILKPTKESVRSINKNAIITQWKFELIRKLTYFQGQRCRIKRFYYLSFEFPALRLKMDEVRSGSKFRCTKLYDACSGSKCHTWNLSSETELHLRNVFAKNGLMN